MYKIVYVTWVHIEREKKRKRKKDERKEGSFEGRLEDTGRRKVSKRKLGKPGASKLIYN